MAGSARFDAMVAMPIYSRSRITVALPCRVPSRPPVPCASASLQSFTCTAGCASPRSWRTASITLVMPPRLAGRLLQRPPPSVLKGSLRSEEHTSELQSRQYVVCRLLLEQNSKAALTAVEAMGEVQVV